MRVFNEIHCRTSVDPAVAADDAESEDPEVLRCFAEEEDGARRGGDVGGCEDGDVGDVGGGGEGEEVRFHAFCGEAGGDDGADCGWALVSLLLWWERGGDRGDKLFMASRWRSL